MDTTIKKSRLNSRQKRRFKLKDSTRFTLNVTEEYPKFKTLNVLKNSDAINISYSGKLKQYFYNQSINASLDLNEFVEEEDVFFDAFDEDEDFDEPSDFDEPDDFDEPLDS